MKNYYLLVPLIKKMQYHKSKNFIGTIADWPNRWTDSRSTASDEYSLDAASNTARIQIKDRFSEMVGGNPTDNNGIIIAHSMGGVVVREMDRMYDQAPLTFGSKPYGGIITFGSPHGGSPIANSIVSRAVENYGKNTCYFIGNQVDLFTSSYPVLNTLGNTVYYVFNGNFISNGITDGCLNLVNHGLSGLLYGRGIVVDAQYGSAKMQNLYTAPNVRKIALIGIEDQPVELKYASSYQAGNSANYFADNVDSNVENKVNDANIMLTIQIDQTPWWRPSAREALENVRNRLLNINRDIAGLTGALQLNYNFTGQCKLDYYDYGNLINTSYVSVGAPEDCDAYNTTSNNWTSEVLSSPQYNGSTSYLPHDGLIPVYSQEAWPGATKLYMNGSNHSQMKNDANTKTYLKEIWGGFRGLWWEIQTK